MQRLIRGLVAIALSSLVSCSLFAADTPPPTGTARGDAMFAEYFRMQTAWQTDWWRRQLVPSQKPDLWIEFISEDRKHLMEMLGLDPMPERTPLNVQVTGTTDHPEFTVERLYFESRPGLYVTGNLYVPKGLKEKVPAILYVCGHANAKKDGYSYGSKVAYQHHGAWFARNGYVCLTLDTLQLGEIEGLHHGLFQKKMWWWYSRGYTPAGVEAWNAVRALDLLQSRPEVDGERLGVTGRSGGGATSWWIAAIDERIKAAVPVAGITDLTNHVVDGVIEGHCDCMYMINTYHWDFAMVAALVAPRALLISNTDKDGIFPLEGVERLHLLTRNIYRLYKADNQLGLQISEGPHKDIPELQVAALRWFNRFLKKQDPPIETAAKKFFEPEELRVFKELPADEKNTTAHEWFVPLATPQVPQNEKEWSDMKSDWMAALAHKILNGFPAGYKPPDLKLVSSHEKDGMRLSVYELTTQPTVRLKLYVLRRTNEEKDDLVVLNALDDEAWKKFLAMGRVGFAEAFAGEDLPPADETGYEQTRKMFGAFKWAMAYVAPRGVGPTAFDPSEKKQMQVRRRFMLLGQTLDSMQVYDVRAALRALDQVKELQDVPHWLQAERQMAGIALYASLCGPKVKRLDLWHLPHSHRDGPTLLNVLRYFDMPAAVAMAAEKSQVRIYQADKSGWEYPAAVSKQLGWNEKQLQVRQVKNDDQAAK